MRALTLILAASTLTAAVAQPAPRVATERMATTIMRAWPNGIVATEKKPGEWSYEEGVLLDGLAAQWQVTHNPAELAYIRAAVDKYILPDGTIRMAPDGHPYPSAQHSLDNIEMGRAVLFCYQQFHDQKYATAVTFLHAQLAAQPRNTFGGYWHKAIYPNQMWLDGAFMAEPFRAQYAVTFHTESDFPDIAAQFLLMDAHMRDPATGLLRHGWDASVKMSKMPWADPSTGLSPEVWSRAVGWFCVALVDVLDWLPPTRPERPQLLDLLRRTLAGVIKMQDPADSVWWQIMDKGTQIHMKKPHPGVLSPDDVRPAAPGNFEEASASAMFVYAIAKSARKGYLPAPDRDTARDIAEAGWQGLQTKFIKLDRNSGPTLTGTVKAAGLGGTPYRSGSFDYYIHEPRGDNDAKGIGAYLLAGSELSRP